MAKIVGRGEGGGFFPQGGKTKMFERGTAHPAVAEYSGKQKNGGDDKEFAEGGKSGAMFSKGHAGKKIPGVSGKQSQEG